MKKSRELFAPPGFPTTSGRTNNTCRSAERKIKILSDQPIFDYWIYRPEFGVVATSTATSTKTITRDSIVFYLNQDGLIFKVKEDAEDEAITPEPIENIQLVKFSSNGKFALIKFGDANFSGFVIFNGETKVQEFLPENITAAAFSPDGKKIVYLQKQVGFKTASDLIVKRINRRQTENCENFVF